MVAELVAPSPADATAGTAAAIALGCLWLAWRWSQATARPAEEAAPREERPRLSKAEARWARVAAGARRVGRLRQTWAHLGQLLKEIKQRGRDQQDGGPRGHEDGRQARELRRPDRELGGLEL